MGRSLLSPVGLQEHESGEGESGLSSLLSVLSWCWHVKMGTRERVKASDLPSDLIHSCAFLCHGWLAGC